MKIPIFLILIWSCYSLAAQQKEIKKPEYVIIAGDQIISKEQLMTYGEEELVKGMQKGVSEEERETLAQKYGEKIGDKEFIMVVDLFTLQERDSLRHANQETSNIPNEVKADEFHLHVNDRATDFKVQLVNGGKVALSELKGKVVLLDFWSTWCAPCIMEFYDVHNKILSSFKKEDFVFLPIAIGEKEDVVKAKTEELKKKGLELNAGIDTDKSIWDNYANGSIPKCFLIDKEGVIKYVSMGNSEGTVALLKSEIEKLISK